jgi:hypothetical protein
LIEKEIVNLSKLAVESHLNLSLAILSQNKFISQPKSVILFPFENTFSFIFKTSKDIIGQSQLGSMLNTRRRSRRRKRKRRRRRKRKRRRRRKKNSNKLIY